MQAGVRKKELLERINGQGDPQQQQQRQFPPKPQQPQQGSTAFPPNGTPPTAPALRQNVKTRLQMTKGQGQQAPAPGWQGGQQAQNMGPGPNPTQQAQQQQQQQRRNVTQLNPIRPGGPTALGNMPMQGALMAGLSPGQAQALGPKSGVKRTVMQRANSGDRAGPHIPQKVRVVKLLGGVSACFGHLFLDLTNIGLQNSRNQEENLKSFDKDFWKTWTFGKMYWNFTTLDKRYLYCLVSAFVPPPPHHCSLEFNLRISRYF